MSVRQQFTFIWKIENLSLMQKINSDGFSSPCYTVDDFEKTKWQLRLWLNVEDSDYLDLVLYRNDEDGGPDKIFINFQLALLTSKAGSTDVELANDSREFPFDDLGGILNYELKISKAISKDELFGIKKSELMPGDVLTIQCRMWQGQGKVLNLGNAVGRSVVGYDKISFPWKIHHFSSWEPEVKKRADVSSLLYDDRLVIFNLFNENHFNNLTVLVEIVVPFGEKLPYVSLCNIYIVSASGNHVECVNYLEDTVFEEQLNGEHFWSFTLSFSKEDILNNKSSYLPNDTLFLLCELSLSDETVVIEEITYSFMTSEINKSLSDLKFGPDDLEKKFLQKDLWALYEKGTLIDMNLITSTKTFPVHSVILCARSPVFQAMLTTEMKEKQERCIIVDDMDDDTVSQLLHFMYCDAVEGLEWENAVSLYAAADKYDIPVLRQICSTFLNHNLTIDNVCEALVLSGTRHDDLFKCAVQGFIVKIITKSLNLMHGKHWKRNTRNWQ